MTKIISWTTLALAPTLGFSAEVFSDNFNRAALGSGYATAVTAGADGGAAITGAAFLELTNDATASTNLSGRLSVATAFSAFGTPFQAVPSANPGLVTWETNLRYNRVTEPSGFGGGNYGAAFVLAGTSADFTAGNGYAVLYGSGVSPEPFRLVRYTGGVFGAVTDLVTGPSLGLMNNYASLRVTYDPSAQAWSLFVRDDGASGWSSPTTLGVPHQAGASVVDSTYTGATMTHLGYLWNYNTAASQTLQADNLRVDVVAAVPEVGATPCLVGVAVLVLGARKRRSMCRAGQPRAA